VIASAVPPVVPGGHLAEREQPVLALSSGLELRLWRAGDVGTLMAAGQDPAIRQWNLVVVASPAEAGKPIERLHERWQNEQGAIWAIAHPMAVRPWVRSA
jgi:hypothetical protein